MFSKKQGRKKRKWQFRISKGKVGQILKKKWGGVGLLLLDNFGMQTFACLFQNMFHFLVNGGEQMLALLVQSCKSGGGEKGPKKCSSAMFYLTRYQVIRKFHRFFFLPPLEKKNFFNHIKSMFRKKPMHFSFSIETSAI